MFMVMGRENKSRWWRFQERATPTDALPTVNTADSVNEISKNKSQMFSLILFISVMTLLCVFITLFVRRHLNVSPHNSAGTLHICIMSRLVNKDNTITSSESSNIYLWNKNVEKLWEPTLLLHFRMLSSVRGSFYSYESFISSPYPYLHTFMSYKNRAVVYFLIELEVLKCFYTLFHENQSRKKKTLINLLCDVGKCWMQYMNHRWRLFVCLFIYYIHA